MTATIVNSGFKEEKWIRMMALSFCFHLAAFSSILFIPQPTFHYPSIEGRVYHVELVGPPPGIRSGDKGKERGIAKRKETSRILKGKTRRISIKKKKPVPVLAKRVSSKPIATRRDNTLSASELVDRAISKIERNVNEEKTNHLEKALSEIEKKLKEEEITKSEGTLDKFEGDSKDRFRGETGSMPGTYSGIGKIILIYQLEIENAIKNNWSYPVTLLNLKRDKIPEAVVIVIVRSDGKILKARFKRRSNNRLFDDSVLKAIEKSDPLPRFPPGYQKSYDEVEISFSLKDLV